MLVCGFTIVRNAVRYRYPVVESIQSVLPLCDHFVVAVGNSEDGTLDLIKSINSPKISIIETVWDTSVRDGGKILSIETNKALDAIASEYDWCFYIQADEVVHEQDYSAIRETMIKWKDNPRVEGLLFNYLHFWGTYNYIGTNRQWYRHEIRIVRNNKSIRSYHDAQGFRINNKKLRVKPVEAYIYHYGWVRPPEVMIDKMINFSAFYHTDEQLKITTDQLVQFSYDQVDAVRRFDGNHPKCMQHLIDKTTWKVDINENEINMRFKDKLLYAFEKTFGYRLFEYKNYKLI